MDQCKEGNDIDNGDGGGIGSCISSISYHATPVGEPMELLPSDAGDGVPSAKRIRTEFDSSSQPDLKSADDSEEFLGAESKAAVDTIDAEPEEEEKQETDEPQFISSEFFKIEILNLPTPIAFPEARRLVQQKLDLQARKVKLSNNPAEPPCIFATFPNEDIKQRALKLANGFEYRKHKLIAKPAKVNRVKQKELNQLEKVEYRPDMTDEEINDFNQIVVNSVAPLQHLPYAEQLDFKHKEVIRIMNSMTKSIININYDLKKRNKNFRVDVSPPLPSAEIDGYRNKNEFTIGRHPNGKAVVGFRVSSFRKGSVHVGSPQNIKPVGEHVQSAVATFDEYLRTEGAKYDPHDPVTGKGLYRTLTIRDCNVKRQLMLLFTISGGILSTKEVEELSENIRQFYASRQNDDTVISFFLKVAELQGQKDKNPFRWIFGEQKICMEVDTMKFQISPDAFFQVNTKSAHTLFKKIVELGGIDNETSVIDVCCGTGTIGIASVILGDAKEVIGIELVESAIENAKTNVELNFEKEDVRARFKFYSGRAEDLVEAAGNTAQGKKIVAIVDPPRSGLGSAVIAALRKNARIQNIVYVACKLEACKENFISFARPHSKKYVGAPFVPQQIVSVDMFPHTKDIECVVLFKRCGTL